MEIKIGVLHAPRELLIDTEMTADQVAKTVSDAVLQGGAVTFDDVRGKRLILPIDKLAYIEIGEPEQRRVGFGG